MREAKGITLIALIITVVIMLILAGVAVSNLVSSDGLFSKVKSGAQEYKAGTQVESSIVRDLLAEVNSAEPVTQVADSEPGVLAGSGTRRNTILNTKYRGFSSICK